MFNKGSPVFDASTQLEPLFYGHLFGIPLPFFYIVVFFGAAHWLMRHMRLGRSIYAVGGNANAARLSGVNVKRTQLYAFVIAGFMSAVGAVLMAARLNSGSPNYGTGLELQAIAAAVIGGASLAGGRGDIRASLFGALTITIVQNGLNLNAVPTSTQNVVIGGIIVLAVGIDMWRDDLSRFAMLTRLRGDTKRARRRQKRRTAMTYPRALSHIGLSVPDVDAAFKWYTEVLGFYPIMKPTTITKDDSAIGVMCTDVFGPDWTSFRICHVSTVDRIGIEMFEFPNNEKPKNNLEYWKTGIFHFCITDPDVEGLAKKIVETGGKQRMPVRHYYPNEKPYRMVYCEDPWGNILEIYSHSYELTYSSGAYV